MALYFNYWFADVVAGIVVLLTTIYIFFQSKYSYWRRKNIHYLQPRFPFGNVKDILIQKKSFGELFYDIYYELEEHKYGGIYEVYRPSLVVRDPELIKNIMVKGFEHFNDHGFYFDENLDPLAAHLFMLSGTRWRNLRAKLSPTFTSGKMKMMFDTLAKCGEELRAYVNNIDATNDGVEIKDVLSRYSTDIISSCAFGLDSNCLKNPDSEFRVVGRKVFQPTLVQLLKGLIQFFIPALSKVFHKLAIPSMPKDITNYFIDLVRETIEYRESNNISRNDFMQLLIQLKNKGYVDPDKMTNAEKETERGPIEHTKLTLNEVAAQAFVFFIAGFETSATTMTFCLYELSNHLDIQTELRNEIRIVLERHNGKVTYEGIQEMKYLDKVVSETLRLHPPLPILNRKCIKTYTIEETGDVIEKGTPIVIPLRALQRDPKYYHNPHKFNPENFNENAVRNRAAFTYMPFGEGPRLCIGQRFGLMQVKVGLISVLQDNKVTLHPKTQIPLKLERKSFITSPLGGMWLNMSHAK